MSEKKRDWGIFIDDILGSIEKIERYTKGKTFERFSHNEIVIDAVIRNFEIIGEAARNIPEEIKGNTRLWNGRRCLASETFSSMIIFV